MTDVCSRWETLTADDARLLLAGNVNNRRVSQPAVEKLAREMAERRWVPTSDAIDITPDDRLGNGQHRMLALIRANEITPGLRVRFAVNRNATDEQIDRTDQGQPRSSGQALGIRGVLNANTVAAAARHVLRYEGFPGHIWSGLADVSKSHVVDFVLKHQDQVSLLDPTMAKRTRLNPSTFLALQWLVLRHSRRPDLWAEFADGIVEGAGLQTGDARLTLRNRGNAPSDVWGGGQARVGVYIKAWNGYVQGRQVKLLRFTRDELPMPTVM